jgi:hypothetical protein
MMNRYRLLDRNEEKLVNQLELATLFLVRCADMYLQDNAMIALVMPRSLYTSDQHHKIRDNSFSNSSVSFTQIWDLDEFSPLFNMPACVVFGQKKEGSASVPLEASIIRGKVNRKDVRLADFDSAVEHKELVVQKAKIILMRQGGRSAWIYEGSNLTERIILNKGTGFYLKKFRQGASIAPRPFWFVEAKGHLKFGLTSSIPYLETTTRAADMAKKDYRGIRLKGNIESEYLYATLLGTDILPFSHLPLRLVLLCFSITE